MIGRKSLFVLAALLLGPAAAQAHGPSRQKVSETVEINAPPAKVWAVIGNFQDLKWLPAIAKSEGSKGNAVGATRHLTFVNGATMDEELDRYSADEMSYATFSAKNDVKALPVSNYSSTITVSPAAGGKSSSVEWRGAFYRGDPLNDPPPALNDDAAFAAVTKYFRTGLDGLKKRIESSN
jgi:hypothetical protein